MTNDVPFHPEPVIEPDPSTQRPLQIQSYDELIGKLRHKRFCDHLWHFLPLRPPEPLLEKTLSHLAPLPTVLHAAVLQQSLFRAGLSRRNPLLLGERARTPRAANAMSHMDLLPGRQLDGGSGIWYGMSGVGKSALLKRTMAAFELNRVIPSGSSVADGCANITHGPYLHVNVATSGSRGGQAGDSQPDPKPASGLKAGPPQASPASQTVQPAATVQSRNAPSLTSDGATANSAAPAMANRNDQEF